MNRPAKVRPAMNRSDTPALCIEVQLLGAPPLSQLLRQGGEARPDARRFVSGHDFSRADEAHKNGRALAPEERCLSKFGASTRATTR